MNPHHQDDRVTIHHGDALEVLRQLPDASVDAVVTDPPYGLEFMGKTWDRLGDIGQASHGGFSKAADNFKGMVLPASYNASANVKCQRCGKWKFDHVGRKCECGVDAVWPNVKAQQARAMQQWHHEWAAECLRVLKPGGHLLAFGGTRTWHRLACAVEDAGFEIRDSIAWIHSQGFPKSLNLPGGIGTALKPAFEPVVCARKPLIGTVALNIERHGTGALNIDACRTATSEADKAAIAGRWPTNVVLDDSQAAELDRQSGERTSGILAAHHTRNPKESGILGAYGSAEGERGYGDSGGASRFFPTFRYEAKAPTSERPRYTRPKLRLRGDLTPEQVDHVRARLEEAGVQVD